MAYITVYYIDFDTKEVISTYDYSIGVGQTQNINVQDHIPAGYLDLFTYNNGNFVYDNSIQVVADEPLYVNGQTGDRFTNNVICLVSATWDGNSNLPIDDLSDGIEGMSVVPVHTSEIAPIDIVDSISITENAMSGQFLTIGDVCYPTCSVSLFKGEYTTATVFLKGSEFYVVAQMFGIYQILGKFTVTNEPTIDTDIISFEGSGVLASDGINSIVDLADVMTSERMNEILQVQPSLDHIIPASLNDMSYYWYFIVEDIFNLFGIPLIIDRWEYCREYFIPSDNIMELLLPSITVSTSADSDGNIITSTEFEKNITWKDIICNIALLLNCNIVEHGGVIHLKRLPTMSSKAKKFYVGADIYDDNSRFSSNKYWFKSATIKYREYGIRAASVTKYPVEAVFWGNDTRTHTAFVGVPSTWNAGAIEYTTKVNCAYLKPYIRRHRYTNEQMITLLGDKARAKSLYRSFDIDEDITWEGLDVFNGVPDVVYTPADVSFLGWNPLMSIGNCFYCKDYDGNNRIIYVGNQTISYSGGVTVSVSSTCNLEDGTSSEYTTSEISSTASGGIANIQSIVNQMLEGVLIRDNALNGTKITDATITGGKITDATITGSKIANSTITSTQIADSTITNAKIANSTITGSKIVDGTLDGSTKIANATISFAKIDDSFVGSLVADSAFVTELQAEIASFGYITAQEADLDYAQINFANVANGTIGTALIHDGAITNAKIANAAINTALIQDGAITNAKIANAAINTALIQDGAITNAKIANAAINTALIQDGTITNAKIADATISFAKIDNSFVGSLVADSAFVTELQADYAQIDFANVANGAIKTALIQDGAITDAKIGGVSANKLTAGTIDASNITVTNLNATNITTGRITVDGIMIDVTNNEASIDGGYIEDGTITMNGFSSDVVARIDGAIETFTCNDIPTLQNYPASTWTASDYDKHVGDVAYVVNPSSSADGYTYRFTKSSNNQYSWVLIKDTDITKALQDILDLQGDVDAIERFDSTVSSFMIETDEELKSIKRRTSSLETSMGTKVDTSTFNELSQTVDENSSNIRTLTTTTDSLGTRMEQAESDIIQNATNIITKVSKTDFTGQNVMSMINQDASSVTISASKVNLNGAVTFSSFSSALQDQVTGISNTATSAQTTANTANTTANSAYAHIRMDDTRDDDEPPSSYMAKGRGSYNEFKLCRTIGISTTAGYCYLTTFVPWGDSSGGRPTQEATFSESDAVYRRYATSDSEWSAWKSTSKILAGWQYSDTTYIDGGNIYTGTITAAQITVGNLSDLSDDMGTITAGVLKSHNYVADTSGMKLTLSNGVWDSKYFKLDATGAITSTAGTIGGWTISSNSIFTSSQSGGITQTVSINSSNTSINLVHLETGKNLNTILGPDSIYIEGRLSNYTADAALTYDNLAFTQTGGGTVYNSAFTPQIFGMSSKKTGQDVALNMTSKGIRITDNLNGNEFSFDYASGLDFTDGTNVVFRVDIAGNLDCQDLTAFGDISTNGSLEVSTDATIYGPITTTGNGTIGGTLNVSGNTTLTENLSVSGTTTLTGNLSVSGTTTLTGLVNAIGGIDVWGKVEGVTLKINDTTNSSFTIAGGGSIGGTLSTSTITSTGAISTTSTITSTGLITAKNGVDSWGKLEGNTLKINNTGTSSFSILGGGSIAGNLAVGGNITSNSKNVVVDDYPSGFMAFTTATVTKNVNSGTGSMTNLTYVDLTPGVYAVECTAEWDSNSTTGYRHICLSTSSTGGAVDRFAAVTGPAGPSYDRQSFVRLFHLTSNTRFYLNVQQTSGGPINTLGGIQALRLGNN